MNILIFGGAGFIGINSAYYFIEKGYNVIIYDNLSRVGSEYNINNLLKKHKNISFQNIDIRDYKKLFAAIKRINRIDAILLLAGQVAVTTSVINPREDFEINALGTFNVLECIRVLGIHPALIYSSTNKVYGKMDDLEINLNKGRYQYSNNLNGIDESRQLDFYSPYGCSKGTGDQYVRDYSRMYDIPGVVFRQSCIYGPNQFGIEDQGWVAWFTIATLLNKKITIYGDGNQIRDVLFVSDLVKAYDLVIQNIKSFKGEIYNIGGGVNHTLSLNELLQILEQRFNKKISVEFGDWRPGDQKVYVSNINKFSDLSGWVPETGIEKGVEEMAIWIEKNKDILKKYVFNGK